MALEITEEDDAVAAASCILIDTEAQKERIRKIIQKQRALYVSSSSSSSFSSAAAVSSSSSSISSSHRHGNLLELMKVGSTSLRRLFDMEHTSLATHFIDYSGSPVVKPILLWGSDSDDGGSDPWVAIKPNILQSSNLQNTAGSRFSFSSPGISFQNNLERSTHIAKDIIDSSFHVEPKKRSRMKKLPRTKSFRRLPNLNIWFWKGFRFRLRLKRLRIMICGRKF